jgi:hypothetical protein
VDLPEGLAQAVRHVDDHGLPVPDHIHLAAKIKYHYALEHSQIQRRGKETRSGDLHRGVDVEVLELGLEVRGAILQIEEGL